MRKFVDKSDVSYYLIVIRYTQIRFSLFPAVKIAVLETISSKLPVKLLQPSVCYILLHPTHLSVQMRFLKKKKTLI
jgi:hypothetical protein